MGKRAGRWGALATATIVAAVGMSASASAAETTVACGDVAALRGAITAANGTAASDTIEVTGAPCTFEVPSSVDAAAGGNGLPIVTQPLIINGHGATIRRTGAATYRLLFAASRLELRELTVSGGLLAGGNNGAGIAGFLANIVLDRVVVSQNAAAAPGRGGGIGVAGGSVDMDRSVVANNQAAFGSAVYTASTTSSNDITRSSMYFNAVNAAGGNSAVLVQDGSAVIENSTIAANAAPNAIAGVTAFTTAGPPGTVAVRSSTLGDNGRAGSAAPGSSLATVGNGSSITATDTIVVDTDSAAAPLSPPCLRFTAGTTIADGGGNVEYPTNACNFGTLTNPRVAYQAAAPGSPVLLARIQPGSSAIDNGGNDCPSVDQRGATRPGGAACDSGSWETQPPDTTADGPDGPTNDPEITFTSSKPNSTFECSVDDAAFASCTSPFSPAGLSDGEHTVEVRAIDAEGYVDPTPASVTFVVDTTGPETTITSGPSGEIHDPTATFGFTSDDEGATFECRLDGAAFAPCTSPKTVSGFAPGTHTFQVRAVDAVGNPDTTPASRTFTYRRCTIRVTLGLFGQPLLICI